MKPRTSSFIFIMLLVAVIALTIGSPVLLSAAICMLVMLVLALASVVTALLTLQARVVCAATRLLRGEKAAYQAEVSFRVDSAGRRHRCKRGGRRGNGFHPLWRHGRFACIARRARRCFSTGACTRRFPEAYG